MSERVRFGELLRDYRLEAELTQADLARLAGIGSETIGALERGVNSYPRKSTVERLSEALGLSDKERAEFEAYAKSRPRARRVTCRREASKRPEYPNNYPGAPVLWGM